MRRKGWYLTDNALPLDADAVEGGAGGLRVQHRRRRPRRLVATGLAVLLPAERPRRRFQDVVGRRRFDRRRRRRRHRLQFGGRSVELALLQETPEAQQHQQQTRNQQNALFSVKKSSFIKVV